MPFFSSILTPTPNESQQNDSLKESNVTKWLFGNEEQKIK
jgi:hypothetical protein